MKFEFFFAAVLLILLLLTIGALIGQYAKYRMAKEDCAEAENQLRKVNLELHRLNRRMGGFDRHF